MRGRCPACDALVVIIPGDWKAGKQRQRHYWPAKHNGPDGKPCPGCERSI